MIGRVFLSIVAIAFFHRACSTLASDESIAACDADNCPERKSLLQTKSRARGFSLASQTEEVKNGQCQLDISGDPDATGNTAPLTEAGFETVRACSCPAQMREFIRRLVVKDSNTVCVEGGLEGLTLFYYSAEYPDSDFKSLQVAVGSGSAAQTDPKCPWIAPIGTQCVQQDAESCPSFPGATHPPCSGCTTSATTTATTTATTAAATTTTTTLPCPVGEYFFDYDSGVIGFDCAGGSGSAQVNLIEGQMTHIVTLPPNVNGADITMEAQYDLELELHLELNDHSQNSCIVGVGWADHNNVHECGVLSQGDTGNFSYNGLFIYYSGDDMDTPVRERIAIYGATQRSYEIKVFAFETSTGTVQYSYGPINPCPSSRSGCAACPATLSPPCPAGQSPHCDGSATPVCQASPSI